MKRMISVVSPFYNEQNILAKALDRMISNLQQMDNDWELIIVNDGSTDESLKVATEKATAEPKIKVVSYNKNQGRGYALKKGIDKAQGEFIVTTEIDCSWGDDIVSLLIHALTKDTSLDIVIASTKLSGGGYVNVPANRVFLSKAANVFLRLTVSKNTTMFTGMTRGYRATAIKQLPISEKGKEFHLDVLAKARAFGLKVGEIPATITWQDEKLARVGAPKRKSSSKIPSIIRSHLLFGLSGRPYRYLFSSSLITGLISMGFLSWGAVNLMIGATSIYLLTLAFSSFILAALIGGIGILSLQQHTLLREIWITRKEIQELNNNNNPQTAIMDGRPVSGGMARAILPSMEEDALGLEEVMDIPLIEGPKGDRL